MYKRQLYKKIGDVLEDGKIVFSPNVNDGIVVSLRGGDFELILGQDISIGYKAVSYTHLHSALRTRIPRLGGIC